MPSRPDAVWPVEMYMDEHIVWRGTPDTGLRINTSTLAMGIFALALILGCLGIATVVNRSIPGVYWNILGPGLALGFGLAIAPLLIDRYERGRTKYRITTHRVLIMRGITVTSNPLPPAEALQLRGDTLQSIISGHDRRNRPILLERLPDAQDVLKTLKTLAKHAHAT